MRSSRLAARRSMSAVLELRPRAGGRSKVDRVETPPLALNAFSGRCQTPCGSHYFSRLMTIDAIAAAAEMAAIISAIVALVFARSATAACRSAAIAAREAASTACEAASACRHMEGLPARHLLRYVPI